MESVMIFDKTSRIENKFNISSMSSEIINEYNALSSEKKATVNRLLAFENSSKNGFELRNKNSSDLYNFDHPLKILVSKILSTQYPAPNIKPLSPIFGKLVDVSNELDNLKQNGYITSQFKLPITYLESIKSSIERFQYFSKGTHRTVMSGFELQSLVKSNKSLTKNGTTFWLEDQSLATHDSVISQLAFDPYILSIVSGYLGCEPIHVQSNIWFSFSSADNTSPPVLSQNAQLFHQDKDFIKFIKVFIYLNDVDENNGPHCYIEGSHQEDELFTKGVPFSTRISDEDITKHYSSDRIKTVTGPAGTIIFGDTCSTHKGMPIRDGSRSILQLEYATSLYMRPYMPFKSIDPSMQQSLSSMAFSSRITQNYDNNARKEYLRTINSTSYKLQILATKVKNKLMPNSF